MASATTTTTSPNFSLPVRGDIFHSATTSYIVETFLEEGTFGKIVNCLRMDDLKRFTVKVMENNSSSVKVAMAEVSILHKLRQLDSDKCNLVKFHGCFNNGKLICLEFEPADQNLLHFMNKRRFGYLSLQTIRPIVKQVATALFHLKAMDVIHSDLKLEHIMLVDQFSQSLRVKVAGFTQAHTGSVAKPGKSIQSLPYRSPEVMLHLPYSAAVDVWSLGCIAASLYFGALIYPGKSQYEMLGYIDQCQGPLPDAMLNSAPTAGQYFGRDSVTGLWRLKKPVEYFSTLEHPLKGNKKKALGSLDSLLDIRPLSSAKVTDKVIEIGDASMFVDLLKGMLQLNAAHRLTPRQVVQHHFISMSHIMSLQLPSQYAKSSIDEMAVCLKMNSSHGEEKDECDSSQSTVQDVCPDHHPYCSAPVRKAQKRKVDGF